MQRTAAKRNCPSQVSCNGVYLKLRLKQAIAASGLRHKTAEAGGPSTLDGSERLVTACAALNQFTHRLRPRHACLVARVQLFRAPRTHLTVSSEEELCHDAPLLRPAHKANQGQCANMTPSVHTTALLSQLDRRLNMAQAHGQSFHFLLVHVILVAVTYGCYIRSRQLQIVTQQLLRICAQGNSHHFHRRPA